jgi:hypothetical protein
LLPTNFAAASRSTTVAGSAASMPGSVSAASPASKARRAVSAAASAASRPCSSAVASVASTFFASLISAPASAPRRRTSSIGSSVKSERNRSTSPSSALRQNCQ